MKKLFRVTLALMLCVSAGFAQEDVGTRVDALQAQVERVLSKAGIHFGGEFRSQFLNSAVSGDAIDSSKKRSESAEYTSVDFDIVARPNTALGARAMFRLHQDWRNFFSDVQNPITTRWLSIDGLVGGMLEYHAGDYLKKLSPLTLWNQETELLYEPEIFAEGRRLAMSEAFVGDSKRLLQGADISLRAELYPILKEIDVDAFGARLATRGTKESMVVANPADFDKYLVGANLGTQVINGFGVSLSDIYIFDYLASYMGNDTAAKSKDPQATNVAAGRLNFDTRTFMDDKAFLAGVSFEAAYSSDKHWKVDGAGISDTAVTGLALDVGFSLRAALGEENGVKLKADYIMNDKTFRNDAAQTPNFMQRQIMNNENGLSGLGAQNPFDAMYRSVFKYVPSQYIANAQPQTKNAYNNVILSPKAYDAYVGNSGGGVVSPNVFQEALPGGLASADRVGPVGNLDGSFFDEALTVGVRGAMLKGAEKEVIEYDYDIIVDNEFAGYGKGKSTVNPAEYLNLGVGASFDFAKIWPILGPSLKIGGSFMMYNVDNSKVVEEADKTEFTQKVESQLISGELVWNFVPRFSFLLGYQSLTTTGVYKVNGKEAPEEKYTFGNLGFGFGYKVADGGALTAKVAWLTGEGPTEVDEPGKLKTREYTAFQPEVYLTVKF